MLRHCSNHPICISSFNPLKISINSTSTPILWIRDWGKQYKVICQKSQNQDLNPGRTTLILLLYILSRSNVGGQRNGKLFQKEYSDAVNEFAVLISVSFNYRHIQSNQVQKYSSSALKVCLWLWSRPKTHTPAFEMTTQKFLQSPAYLVWSWTRTNFQDFKKKKSKEKAN